MRGSCTTCFRYPWIRIPQSTSGKSGLRIPFTQPSLEGIVRRPLPTKMGSLFPSFVPGQRIFSCLYQVINVFLFIPGYQHLLVYTRSSTSSCLYQVINILLFIPGHQTISCLYQGKRAIHTNGRGVVGASWAGIMPKSGSWAVCASGAWASVIHAYGMALGSE